MIALFTAALSYIHWKLDEFKMLDLIDLMRTSISILTSAFLYLTFGVEIIKGIGYPAANYVKREVKHVDLS